MKLSMIRRMALDTIDRHESGDETAARELHAWCVENLDDVVQAMGGAEDPRIRATIRDYPLGDFPKALLKTCEARAVKERAREATRLAKTNALDAAAGVLGAGVALDGVAYIFDPTALLAVLKAARPNDWLYFGVDGYRYCLRVPVRALKDLHRVHKLTDCIISMLSPLLQTPSDGWRFIVQWGTRGYYQSRVVRELSERHDDAANHVHVTVPSLTTMVSRELGVEAA